MEIVAYSLIIIQNNPFIMYFLKVRVYNIKDGI